MHVASYIIRTGFILYCSDFYCTHVLLQRYSLLNPIDSPTNEEDYSFMEQTDDSQVAIAI